LDQLKLLGGQCEHSSVPSWHRVSMMSAGQSLNPSALVLPLECLGAVQEGGAPFSCKLIVASSVGLSRSNKAMTAY
jgi:hypothetical protein